MKSLFIGLYILSGLWIVSGIFVFSKIKETYRNKEIFTNKLLNYWYLMWALHHIPVILGSLFGVWLIPGNKKLFIVGGLIIFIVGVVILLIGMVELRSLRRSTGQDISMLIITGIYRWSRNSQFVGWFMVLLGVSLIGRSGFALCLTIVFMVVLHLYTIFLEEPYLEDIYGEEYRRYKANTPRYIGIFYKHEEIA